MQQHNPNILNLMESGPFCIEYQFAVEVLASYSEEIDLLKAGVPFADLGIGERRARSMPGLIVMNEGSYKLVNDSEALRNERLTPRGSFAHLRLEGFMRSQDGMSSRGVNSLIDDLQAANENPNIEGILLEINTGGGQALAGDILNVAIAGSEKPVVALGHFVASAGYMAAMAADEIIASNAAARFGSIGTMMSLPKGFANWYTSKYQDIYASKSTNKNRSFRSFLDGDLSAMKQQLEEINEAFLAAVKDHRQLAGNDKYQAHTLSGELFTAKEARRRGLIDGIGGKMYALKRLTAAAKRRKAEQ